jgi:hypothetical protein
MVTYYKNLSHKCSHDEIAKFLGVPANSFDVMYPDKATEMKRMVLDYIKLLTRADSQNTGPARSTGEETNGFIRNRILTNESGFPMAPRPLSWKKVTKVELEPLYRMYIARHYQLACRSADRQAPFDRIATNPIDFIQADYWPTGISIKDPRSMKLEALILFFQHVIQREESHGIPHAFRFHTVLSSRKGVKMVPARYIYDGDEPGREVTPPPVPRKRRKAPANTGNADLLLATTDQPSAADQPSAILIQ